MPRWTALPPVPPTASGQPARVQPAAHSSRWSRRLRSWSASRLPAPGTPPAHRRARRASGAGQPGAPLVPSVARPRCGPSGGGALAQEVGEDGTSEELPGVGVWQLFPDNDDLRRLRAPEPAPGPSDEVLGGDLARCDDGGGDPLTPFLVRQSDDGDVGDGGVLGQHRFDLGGSDVLAPPDDRVVTPALNEEITVGVEPPEIPGGEPAVGVERRGPAEVLAGDLLAPHADLPDLAGRQGEAVGAADAHLHPGKNPPGRLEP